MSGPHLPPPSWAPDEKRCPACATVKPAAAFSPDRHKRDGLASKCRACDQARARRYYAANKATKAAYDAERAGKRAADRAAIRVAAVAVYGGRCARCGSAEVLEFDHVNGGGDKHREVESLGQLLRRIVVTGARLEDVELQLLCRPHHREKTRAERKRMARRRT